MKTSIVVAALLLSLPARAEEPVQPETQTVYVQKKKKDRGEILVAVKIGALFPQGFSKLQTSYLVDLEVGYALPVLRHRLVVALDGAFTAPEAEGSTSDPRLDASGGTYSWKLEQRELILGLTVLYRHPIGRWIPYIGVGPRLFLLESKVSGMAGTVKISSSSEVSSKVGAGIPLGVGVTLGPGQLFAEMSLNIAPIDHRTTGDDNTGSIALAVGYRLPF